MKSVYIFHNKRKSLYKIGISKSPEKRSGQVGLKVDFSFYLPLFFSAKIEVFLHKMLSSKQEKQPGSGGTEWFKLNFIVLIFVLSFLVAMFAAQLILFLTTITILILI